MKIGFLINPVAGMGGRVGLKGTDDLARQAAQLGARPVAEGRASEMLLALRALLDRRSPPDGPEWLTCSGQMGEDTLRSAGFAGITVLHDAAVPSSAADTRDATGKFVDANAALIVFCGGDGTARDIATVTDRRIPILGIPSGVKMYSGVFGMTPERTAEMVMAFLSGKVQVAETDLLDLDEESYRRGEWVARPTGSALTPFEPTLTQMAKAFVVEVGEADAKVEIAAELRDRIAADPGALFLLGPGTTVRAVAELLGVEKTLLGIDALVDGQSVGHDLNEQAILALLDRYPAARLVVSPIGAQGFVLGRGNLQLSPEVVRRIGVDNLIVVATPAKLSGISALHFDTGDAELDRQIGRTGYIPVVVDYHTERMVPVG